MHTLPIETLFQIALNLPLEPLLNLCQTDYRMGQLCQSEYFWQKKLQQDYAEPILNFPKHVSIKEAYLKLASVQGRFVPLYYKGQLMGLFWPDPNLTYLELIQLIEQEFVAAELIYIYGVNLEGKEYYLMPFKEQIGDRWNYFLKLNVQD